MTYKIYSERKMEEDLSIEVNDESSANNVINVLQSQVASDEIRYFSREVKEEVVEQSEEDEADAQEENDDEQ